MISVAATGLGGKRGAFANLLLASPFLAKLTGCSQGALPLFLTGRSLEKRSAFPLPALSAVTPWEPGVARSCRFSPAQLPHSWMYRHTST